MPDKYTATWISHTSIRDFLDCPQAYFYKHVYRDPKTGNKIKLISPPLSLGKAVHEVIESLSKIPVDRRLTYSLFDRYDEVWQKITGIGGGFVNKKEEADYRLKGMKMIERLARHPGPLKNLAVKIKQDLPYFWLSEEDNIILCGKIDWLEYLSETDSLHIIDFKTGNKEEKEESLQLPIYLLLTENCQSRPVSKVSYWYLNKNDDLTEQKIPNRKSANKKILSIGKEIKLARSLSRFRCHKGTCHRCSEMEQIISGKATFVGHDEYGADEYMLSLPHEEKEQSEIL